MPPSRRSPCGDGAVLQLGHADGGGFTVEADDLSDQEDVGEDLPLGAGEAVEVIEDRIGDAGVVRRRGRRDVG